jgi:DNA mismatch repair protein MutL
MGRIQVMPASLANQIAAGEVVERPASVVKELIENSLDAGAKSIFVSLEEGGIQRIVVQDDGSGMDEEDARLAFARHATSKVRESRDLFRIATLGFRGEALASIAAVARVTLATRPRDAEAGVRVRMDGSRWVGDTETVGMPPGTRIEVADLFFNTPARLKYLRSVATEQARCLEVVQRAALSRPDVAFRCEVAGRTLFQSQGTGQLVDVLAAIYGLGEARQFLEVSGETPDYRLRGFIGRPNQGRSSRAHGHLFINDRPIRNLTLHQAVVAGYQGRLMINRHPMYALRIEMDPSLVDVNIHPHKAEVRLSEERDVARLVEESVRRALDGAFLVAGMPTSSGRGSYMKSTQGQLALERATHFGERTTGGGWSTGRLRIRADGRDISQRLYGAEPLRGETASQPGAGTSDRENERKTLSSNTPKAMAGLETSTALVAGMPDNLPLGASTDSKTASLSEGMADTNPFSQTDVQEASDPRRRLANLRLVGQALGMYIVAEDGENLYIIDQHAAHERVLYERFKARMEAEEVRRVPLLTPIPLTLSETARSAVWSRRDELADMGLELEEFGGRDLLLRTIPDVWEGLDAASLAEELLESLTEVRHDQDVRAAIRERIVTRACKTAIKANHRLSPMEMQALCDSLATLADPFHCPHGRPVFMRLTNRDLEKGFKRIV